MYKAVFLDLDGTLLDNEKKISKENIEAIDKARKKGAIVSICSGRQIDVTSGFKDMAHADSIMICSNGAIIYDDFSISFNRGYKRSSVSFVNFIV